MPKQMLKWVDIKTKDIRGGDCYSGYPHVLDLAYGGTLLSRILTMPKKNPISLQGEVLLLNESTLDAIRAKNIKREIWLKVHFVEWIEEQGFHIEIDGDEFEPLHAIKYPS
jgi:hypothetical protein